MLTSSGWSRYRWQQEMVKRMRSYAAKKGWRTRRLTQEFKAIGAAGWKPCKGRCGRDVRADAPDQLCGRCWSAKAVRRNP